MIYRVKQKFFKLSQFNITDKEGQDCFLVKGKVFSFARQFSFQDLNGNELALIKQKLWSWKPRYQIFIDGALHTEIVKEWTWFKMKLTLNVPNQDNYIVQGSFDAYEFAFTRNEKKIASISKKFWSWSDSYAVDIAEEENHIPVLCSCIVIDAILAARRNSSHD